MTDRREKEGRAPHKKERIHGGWKQTLAQLMKRYGAVTADGRKRVSFATQTARREHLYRTFNDLRDLGYRIKDVRNLKGKHVCALVQHYAQRVESGTLAVSTVANRVSHLRVLATWLDKPGLVKPLAYYTDVDLTRTRTAQVSKVWADRGIDTAQTLDTVKARDVRVGLALQLQHAFGLRTKESLLLRPHVADQGVLLNITHGSKGGRPRAIPIQTTEQRVLLDKLKQHIHGTDSLIPRGMKYITFRRHYYRVLTECGISRHHGMTAHGLRHAHLCTLYASVTGQRAPVRCQGAADQKVDNALDAIARQQVAERAGHYRPDISHAYLGGHAAGSDR